MLNDSQIPAPRVPITEKEGGLITREWFRFFNFVYEQVLQITPYVPPVPVVPLSYGSFSGFTTTTWSSFSTNQVSITDTALSSGVSVAASQVTVTNAGLYSVNASFQLYNPTIPNPYSIILWARVSGVDVPGSLRYISVPGNNAGGAQSFSSHAIALTLQLPAAAYIEFYGASALGVAQLRTIAAGDIGIPAPSAASILLNVTQIA